MRLAVLLAVTVLTAACHQAAPLGAPAGVERASGPIGAKSVVGRLVVKWKSRQAAQAVYAKLGVAAPQAVDGGTDALELPSGVSAAEFAAAAGAELEYAEPDYVMRTLASSAAPNDPLLPQQYALRKVEATRAWATQRGSADVRIAVVDTGADLNHPDLKPQIAGSASVIGWRGKLGLAGAKDENGHGTHCAGVAAAAANNKEGIVGMAPGCKLLVVKALGADGSGATSDVARGVHWAIDHGADVISLSVGGEGDAKAMRDAVARALKAGIVVVAAMGNEGKLLKNYPAAYPGVIAVGATTATGAPARFSTRGSWISVAAPGAEILSTTPTYGVALNAAAGLERTYGKLSGTSMATPLVAGLAALVKSQHADWTPAQVKAAIERGTAGGAFNERTGHGVVNAAATLQIDRE